MQKPRKIELIKSVVLLLLRPEPNFGCTFCTMLESFANWAIRLVHEFHEALKFLQMKTIWEIMVVAAWCTMTAIIQAWQWWFILRQVLRTCGADWQRRLGGALTSITREGYVGLRVIFLDPHNHETFRSALYMHFWMPTFPFEIQNPLWALPKATYGLFRSAKFWLLTGIPCPEMHCT